MKRKFDFLKILFLFLLPSCMFTNALKQKLYIQKHDSKEYNLPIYPQNYKIICGMQNRITHNNKVCYQLQFDSLLKGKNRFLNIEFPIDNKENEFPFIYESRKKVEKGTLCYVYLIGNASFYSNEKSEISKLFDYSYRTPSNFDSIKVLLPTSQHVKTGDTVIMANLNFSNYYNSNDIAFIIWQKDTTNNWQAKNELYFPVVSKTYTKPIIKWKKRNRIGYYAKHSFYIVTFCADIVTFPFQILVLKGQAK